ncbi:HesB/YadR/YfhF family protein [Enterococcus olivae]
MKVTVTAKALDWFKQEVKIQPEMGIRFFGKIYGNTQVHDGFSVGMSVDRPENPLFKEEIDGILFFAEESDDWFFKGLEMVVDYDEKLNEPKYLFSEVK